MTTRTAPEHPAFARVEALVYARHHKPLAIYLRERYAAGASQHTLARDLGVAQSTLGRWMKRLGIEARAYGWNGRGSPGPDQLP